MCKFAPAADDKKDEEAEAETEELVATDDDNDANDVVDKSVF